MAQTYQQIQRQIEALQRQAEKLKAQEVGGVVERIKVAIAHYGLTAEQLGFGASNPASRKSTATSAEPLSPKSAEAKYTDGAGNAWSGRGPRPHWLRDALAAGKSLDSFASKGRSTATRKLSTKAPKKRMAQHYSDGNGNSWSGFGPRPRWLKEALDGGASLEQFATGATAQKQAST